MMLVHTDLWALPLILIHAAMLLLCHGNACSHACLLLQVAIALSLLVAEVTAAPFNETVCTFSAQPQLHTIKSESLVSKVCICMHGYDVL